MVTAIVRFKHGRQDLLRTLAQLLAAGLSELSDVDTILAPVPLHPRRLRQRGFNQAWELARYAARQLPLGGRPRLMPSALVRVRDSPKPDGVDHRKLRAEGAFRVPNAQAIRGKTVILVDDVMTTGATLNACAVVLVEAGAKAVCAVTVARAV